MVLVMEPKSRLVQGTDLAMVMDHGQFYVHGGGADSVYDLVEAALQGEKWASNGRSIVVITPVEYNFDMPVRVEVWDGPPPTDLADWTMHNTTELQVSSNTLQLESTSGEPRATAVPNGHYLVEVAGRRFPSSLSTKKSEQWRIRLWLTPSHKPKNDRSIAGEAYGPAGDAAISRAEPPPPQLHLKNSARQP